MAKRKAAKQESDGAAWPPVVKVTLRLSGDTARRLTFVAAERRRTQSAVAEEVLSAALGHWRIPYRYNPAQSAPGDAEGAEGAA